MMPEMRYKRRVLVGLLLTVGLMALVWWLFLAGARPRAIQRDYDCNDFRVWAEADRVYREAGGPERDPYRLDGDNDGVPCESLLR